MSCGTRLLKVKHVCAEAVPKREGKQDASSAQKVRQPLDVRKADRRGAEGKLEHQLFDEVAIKVRYHIPGICLCSPMMCKSSQNNAQGNRST